jgi:arylsulfatase A-like enzyme
LPPPDRFFLQDEDILLPEALQPAGYTAASIGKWHLGFPSHWPDRVGFDLNVGGYNQGMPPSYFFPYESSEYKWNPSIPTLRGGRPGEYLTTRLTDEAMDFIERSSDRSFFLYLSHYSVHVPLEAPEKLVQKYRQKLKRDDSQINAAYAAMVETVDDSVGRIVAAVERLGLSDETIIIFTSDNGGLEGVTRNRPLRLGKTFLYEGGLRVPLIVKWPGRVSPGSICEVPAMGADLYPTITEMAGGRTQPAADLDGKSLVPLLRGESGWGGRDLFWYYPHYAPVTRQPGAAIRSGAFKLIQHYDPPRLELYNLEEDLGEQRDLAAEMPQKVRELEKRIADWLADEDFVLHQINPDYDPEWRTRVDQTKTEFWNRALQRPAKP